MNRAPAFQLYPAKALSGTLHLSGDAFKAYWMVLWWMWQHGTPPYSMPDTDDNWQMATLIADKDKLQAVRKEIMNGGFSLLKKRSGKLISQGLKKESDKQKRNREQRSVAANVRWHSELQECIRIAGAVQADTTPTVSPHPIDITSSSSSNTDVKKKKISWLTPFCDLWEKHTGGPMACAKASKPLASLVKKYGAQLTIDSFDRYLIASDIEYVSVARFSQTFKAWDGTPKKEKPKEEWQIRQEIKAVHDKADHIWNRYSLNHTLSREEHPDKYAEHQELKAKAREMERGA